MLDKDQTTEALRMLRYIAASKQEPMQKPEWNLSDSERATLKRCWHDGITSQEEYNLIFSVYNRFRGIKTPEQSSQSIKDFVNEGRRKNGLPEC